MLSILLVFSCMQKVFIMKSPGNKVFTENQTSRFFLSIDSDKLVTENYYIKTQLYHFRLAADGINSAAFEL